MRTIAVFLTTVICLCLGCRQESAGVIGVENRTNISLSSVTIKFKNDEFEHKFGLVSPQQKKGYGPMTARRLPDQVYILWQVVDGEEHELMLEVAPDVKKRFDESLGELVFCFTHPTKIECYVESVDEKNRSKRDYYPERFRPSDFQGGAE